METNTTSKRKTQNGYKSAKLHAKRARKRREAEDRQFEYDKKTTAQKLKELGKIGSTRQRARLEALLAKEKAPQVKAAPLTSEEKGNKQVRHAQELVQKTTRVKKGYKPSDDSLATHASFA